MWQTYTMREQPSITIKNKITNSLLCLIPVVYVWLTPYEYDQRSQNFNTDDYYTVYFVFASIIICLVYSFSQIYFSTRQVLGIFLVSY